MTCQGKWRLIRLMAVLLIAATMIFVTFSNNRPCGGLYGTFVQLTTDQARRPEDDWRRLFEEFQAIGIKQLFLQWTINDGTAFFPTTRFMAPDSEIVPTIMKLAAQRGIEVWVGLRLDPQYWERIKAPPEALDLYLRNRLKELDGFVGDLGRTIDDAPFAGWYIPDEIDDQTWLVPEKRAILKRYLGDTVRVLEEIRPGSAVAISGFGGSRAKPKLLAEFWEDIVKSTGVSLLLFQDGVGEGKIATDTLPRYYKPLNRSVRTAGARLGAVVELFVLQPDGRRVPAPITRIWEQIARTRHLTSFPAVAFSVPDYMSILAGQQGEELLTKFLATVPACRG